MVPPRSESSRAKCLLFPAPFSATVARTDELARNTDQSQKEKLCCLRSYCVSELRRLMGLMLVTVHQRTNGRTEEEKEAGPSAISLHESRDIASVLLSARVQSGSEYPDDES